MARTASLSEVEDGVSDEDLRLRPATLAEAAAVEEEEQQRKKSLDEEVNVTELVEEEAAK